MRNVPRMPSNFIFRFTRKVLLKLFRQPTQCFSRLRNCCFRSQRYGFSFSALVSSRCFLQRLLSHAFQTQKPCRVPLGSRELHIIRRLKEGCQASNRQDRPFHWHWWACWQRVTEHAPLSIKTLVDN